MNPTQQQMQQQIQASLKDATSVECEECKNAYFKPAFLLRKISALVSPTGQEIIVPVQVLKCDSCNHVNEAFLNNS